MLQGRHRGQGWEKFFRTEWRGDLGTWKKFQRGDFHLDEVVGCVGGRTKGAQSGAVLNCNGWRMFVDWSISLREATWKSKRSTGGGNVNLALEFRGFRSSL